MHKTVTILLIFSVLFQNINAQEARPSRAQLDWHKTEFYLFLHFGPNTFTNQEWGKGTEKAGVFNPTSLDVEQWCRVAQLANARGIVITAKHHDGFCLWPSKQSTHTVRESGWRKGEGDVLRDLSAACSRHGLKFGVYLSPWDRNHPKYGTPQYNDVYASTLTELLTGYGNLFEIWWDGANGEGKNGKKQWYDFHRFEKLVAQYQNKAIIFSDIGPGCRWAGNEQGTVNETNWCTLDTAGYTRGAGGPPADTLQRGNENGALWVPAECDVSIRPGWFYHPEEDDKVKTADQLFDIYLKSVGRGANLILNVPPDRRGRIHENDSLALSAFGQKLDAAFAKNLAKGKYGYFNPQPNMQRMLGTMEATDGSAETYVAFTPASAQPQLELDLGAPTAFNAVLLQENIAVGQRVKAFVVEVWADGQWREVARSTTIGHKKILTFPETSASKLRVLLTAYKAPPQIGELQVYKF